jgi:hypothetical protein
MCIKCWPYAEHELVDIQVSEEEDPAKEYGPVYAEFAAELKQLIEEHVEATDSAVRRRLCLSCISILACFLLLDITCECLFGALTLLTCGGCREQIGKQILAEWATALPKFLQVWNGLL